jgi:hypothetical protein
LISAIDEENSVSDVNLPAPGRLACRHRRAGYRRYEKLFERRRAQLLVALILFPHFEWRAQPEFVGQQQQQQPQFKRWIEPFFQQRQHRKQIVQHEFEPVLRVVEVIQFRWEKLQLGLEPQ